MAGEVAWSKERARREAAAKLSGLEGAHAHALKELQDAHYLAAYNQGDDDEAPVNAALRALGEKQVD